VSAGGLTIADFNYYVGEDGLLYWAAMGANDTDQVLSGPSVLVTFFTDDGGVAAEDSDFTGFIGPGGTVAFAGSTELLVLFTTFSVEPSVAELREPGTVVWDLPYVVESSATDEFDSTTLTSGTLTNPNEFDADLWLYAVFGSDADRLVDADYTGILVPAGETVPFEVYSYKPGAAAASQADVVVTWSNLTEFPPDSFQPYDV
jgi:hypothetical protein